MKVINMKLCPEHLEKLQQSIKAKGLGDLISADKEELDRKLKDQNSTKQLTRANVDPLYVANLMISQNFMITAGGRSGLTEVGCPICFLDAEDWIYKAADSVEETVTKLPEKTRKLEDLTEKVRAEIERAIKKPGVYISVDSATPGMVALMISENGQIFSIKRDQSLSFGGFYDTIHFVGPIDSDTVENLKRALREAIMDTKRVNATCLDLNIPAAAGNVKFDWTPEVIRWAELCELDLLKLNPAAYGQG